MVLVTLFTYPQGLSTKLSKAIMAMEDDDQFKHASLSLYVADTKSGKVIFEKNGQLGLAPASCQKVITSVSAFDLLGKTYKFKTELAYEGNLNNLFLNGNLYVIGYGDPTLGSWRWKQTAEKEVLSLFKEQIAKKFNGMEGNVFGYDRKWESNITPRGWIWEDIGNYYGAGASSLNWRENQFDLFLKAGEKTGDKASIVKMVPILNNVGLYCEVITAPVGTGDNAYIFLPPYSPAGYVRGTIPLGENNFKISGAVPDPGGFMIDNLVEAIKKKEDQILFTGSFNGIEIEKKDLPLKSTVFYTYYSPPLDSINYWFLKKSINLYGEALVKTIGFEKANSGSTDSGVSIIKNFWKNKGIDPSALNIIDGSGLSPANRVTTHALVTIMQYAKNQDWFPSFYLALPEMNGIKMKDGYINGVRSYTGYCKNNGGAAFTFSFIVNNFCGNPGLVREKMYKVLDLLK
jgi:D-alanyl-D-alanine carboxypeptidase/D-alanyl-D-alanine-endopeptidase (penicillin-binding protein 4)